MSNIEQAANCPKCGTALAGDAPEGLCPRCLMALNLAPLTEISPEDNGSAASASTKPPPPSPAEIAPHFPQLEIIECLGRGGMGAVYKARQKRIDRLVALKILAPERQGDALFTERFQREARALARLNHPNIVAVHDFGEAGGFCYLLMEFVEGVTLRNLMQRESLTSAQAFAIVPKICDALQFAHTKGIVHRDIKPENILLSADGQVKIADFGIAKLATPGTTDQTLTGVKEVVGTPHYMAPEQAEKPATVDHRADIFSLGVVIYEMLTGELPLGKFPPPSRKVQVDIRLDEIVLRTLEKEPDLRYQHISQVKTDLETIAGSTPAAAAPRIAPAHPSVAGRSRTLLPWAALALVILLAAVLAWLWNPPTTITKPAGCVAWWPGESNATDIVGNNKGAALYGTEFTSGKHGKAFRLDGVDDFVCIPASTSLDVGIGPGFTLEAWINPTDVTFGRPIFEWNTDASALIGLHLWIGHPGSPDGYLFANLYDGVFDRTINTAPGTIIPNVFQHVALTYDKTSGLARMFINGAQVKELGFGSVNVRTTPDLLIGGRPSPVQPRWFKGIIDEPSVYNRALTPIEVRELYQAGRNELLPTPNQPTSPNSPSTEFSPQQESQHNRELKSTRKSKQEI